ncbi:aaa family [Diplodia corticola]|uniref:Aaa family n=1 Tax=Diplodia corticola TaxID=236234 RepID=A0A1J9R4Z3_9PEZI|nr:aaa family [Diplodia corticola]OJD36550.1 aaa family [Diplodia corticola]
MSEETQAETQGANAGADEVKRIKRVDEYYDYRTYSWKQKKSAKPQKKKDAKGVVLLVRRKISVKGKIKSTEIDIRNAALAQVLKDLNCEAENLEQRDPPVADPVLFYHSRHGLKERLEAEKSKDQQDQDLITGLCVALDYIASDHVHTMASMKTLLANKETTWELVWALFTPNRLVYHYHELTQQVQLLRFRKATQRKDQEQLIFYWHIDCDMIVFDGDKFGLSKVDHLRIDEYPGSRNICDLPVYPLEFAEAEGKLFEHAVARGKRYASIREAGYVECDGPAMREILNKDLKPKRFTFSAFGRAMIDPKGFRTFQPNATYNSTVYKQLQPDLSAEQYAICNPVIMGFSFGMKQWGGLGMDYCREIAWGNDAFSSLVLEANKKTLIHSLVTQHMSKSFDDVVVGKGKGLVGLLSGRPGCGKTLTAEAISEETRKPLYSVSAGELGTDPSSVDTRLTEILELANRWGAILLLDEADVFLQRRNDTDVVRNALVSIFLRQLEYYKGILILTTNRIGIFDDAFESRIHFSLHYPDLDFASRRQLWLTFFKRLTKGTQVQTAMDDAQMDELAGHDLNGRQIKNLLSNAISMALHQKSPLSIDHIRTALNVLWGWRKAVEQELSARAATALDIEDGGPAP